MKCKKCGHVARTIGAMAKHYRQKHPSSLKRKAAARRSTGGYCSKCGRKL